MPNPALKSLLKRLLPSTVWETRRRLAVLRLLETNLFASTPTETKRLFVANARKVLGYPIFIETGTFEGAMARHASGLFRSVHTIELQPDLARAAKERLSDRPNVTVHQGDSSAVLRDLLPTVRESAVFWLDAHYSGGVTARGPKDTPILEELDLIEAHPVRPHALFIDDARVFGIDESYPPLEQVIERLRRIGPDYHIGVLADVLWAAPVPILRFEWTESERGVVELPPTQV